MKAVFCPNCQDLVALRRTPRNCTCGLSGGRYRSDDHHADVWGKAIAIGLAGQDLAAVCNPKRDEALAIRGWAFEPGHPRVRRLKHHP